MAKNEFKPFATGAGANVTPQADWESLPARQSGFQSGKASSAQVNKALRQSSFVASALAQFISTETGLDVLDDGDANAFIEKLKTSSQGRLLNTQVFKTSGVFIPTTGTRFIRFQAWGGGGSGATPPPGTSATASGGGGGAYIEGIQAINYVTPIIITVGAGGASVPAGGMPSKDGGITQVGDFFAMTSASKGYGGTVTPNLAKYPNMLVIHQLAGGNSMGGVSDHVGGYGGAAFCSAPSNPHTTAGEPNFLPGGGGAGGAITIGVSGASGAGGNGQVIIQEYS